MPAMKSVEVSRLVRGVNRHTGKARLLEVEDPGAGDSVDERHAVTSGYRGIFRSRFAALYANVAMTMAA